MLILFALVYAQDFLFHIHADNYLISQKVNIYFQLQNIPPQTKYINYFNHYHFTFTNYQLLCYHQNNILKTTTLSQYSFQIDISKQYISNNISFTCMAHTSIQDRKPQFSRINYISIHDSNFTKMAQTSSDDLQDLKCQYCFHCYQHKNNCLQCINDECFIVEPHNYAVMLIILIYLYFLVPLSLGIMLKVNRYKRWVFSYFFFIELGHRLFNGIMSITFYETKSYYPISFIALLGGFYFIHLLMVINIVQTLHAKTQLKYRSSRSRIRLLDFIIKFWNFRFQMYSKKLTFQDNILPYQKRRLLRVGGVTCMVLNVLQLCLQISRLVEYFSYQARSHSFKIFFYIFALIFNVIMVCFFVGWQIHWWYVKSEVKKEQEQRMQVQFCKKQVCELGQSEGVYKQQDKQMQI